MDSNHKDILYLERAKSELELANAIFKLSVNATLKAEFELKSDSTFFSKGLPQNKIPYYYQLCNLTKD